MKMLERTLAKASFNQMYPLWKKIKHEKKSSPATRPKISKTLKQIVLKNSSRASLKFQKTKKLNKCTQQWVKKSFETKSAL